MDSQGNICEHLNEIIDHIQGDIICTDCGLVLSAFYVSNYNCTLESEKSNEYVLEVLARLNLPKYFAMDIEKNLDRLTEKEKKKENTMAFVIYKTLNDLGCGVTLKEINSVTGFTDSQIYNKQASNETVIIDPHNSVEKYCALIGLPKQSVAVIKGNISLNKTGHNPLTIIGSAIYNYCKEKKIPITLDKIAKTLNISPISIRRFSKLKP